MREKVVNPEMMDSPAATNATPVDTVPKSAILFIPKAVLWASLSSGGPGSALWGLGSLGYRPLLHLDDPVLEARILNVFGDLAIPERSFEGDQLRFLERSGES